MKVVGVTGRSEIGNSEERQYLVNLLSGENMKNR